jgi:hypothetical protein
MEALQLLVLDIIDALGPDLVAQGASLEGYDDE